MPDNNPTQPARACPALLLSAPSSGQGKTLVTAALARLHSRQGRRVRVFKCGPDFLDPQILAQASGSPVYQLDLALQGEEECRRLLWEGAKEADLILIEGVMGLHDGSPSAADLSLRFNIPVLAVMDVSGMANTVSALACGLFRHREGLPFAGVIANRAGSARHCEIISTALRESGYPELTCRGCLMRSASLELPSRHLGLWQADEIAGLSARLDQAADMLESSASGQKLPEPVRFYPPRSEQPLELAQKALLGLRLGIAKDQAFSFIYQANLDLLRALGAELIFFSPLRERLPEIDSLYLPGGYPELYLEELSANRALFDDIRQHHRAGKPVLAEGGGLLYLLDRLQDKEGREAELAGLLPGRAVMQSRLAALGRHDLALPEGVIRGHTYHYSKLECGLEPLERGHFPDGRPGECVYRVGSLTASCIHAYFPSNPQAICHLFKPGGKEA